MLNTRGKAEHPSNSSTPHGQTLICHYMSSHSSVSYHPPAIQGP